MCLMPVLHLTGRAALVARGNLDAAWAGGYAA